MPHQQVEKNEGVGPRATPRASDDRGSKTARATSAAASSTENSPESAGEQAEGWPAGFIRRGAFIFDARPVALREDRIVELPEIFPRRSAGRER